MCLFIVTLISDYAQQIWAHLKQVGGEKRKYSKPIIVHETKSMENKTEKAKEAPLKAEIIMKLNALEKEYEALKEENEKLKTKTIELDKCLLSHKL